MDYAIKTKSSEHIVDIKPSKGWVFVDVKELWRYHELLYFLTWRDIKVRYKQTAIGAGWAVLQPFMTMIIFTIFFGRMAQIPSEGIPYPLFSYSGLLLWTYFSSSVTRSGNSLVGSAHLITKVYFPRLIIPLSSALAGILDYMIALCILVFMMFFYGFFPNFSLALLPVTVLLAFISATGFGLWLSALNVKYRDVGYVIPFFIQLMLFATPVIYPTSIVPERFRWLLALNPITGIIEAHRACILGHKSVDWSLLALSSGIAALIFITGLIYFRRVEKTFADVI